MAFERHKHGAFMAEKEKVEILLESGTNEVEMLEFSVFNQYFGVNVSKVKSIVQYDENKLTRLPKSTEGGVETLIDIHNQSIALLDARKILHLAESSIPERQIVILLGFNNISVAILVDSVIGIHRINWSQFIPINESMQSKMGEKVVGTFNPEGHDVVVLDFEKIMVDYFPETNMDVKLHDLPESPNGSIKLDRSKAKIIHVDDSLTIRKVFQRTMIQGGYGDVTAYPDGQDCYDKFKKLNERIKAGETTLHENVQAIIIDIEMPRMDGLTLCRRIREEFGWKDVYILLFSSLIDDQMKAKCESVGASHQIAKPDIAHLADLLDTYFLEYQQQHLSS